MTLIQRPEWFPGCEKWADVTEEGLIQFYDREVKKYVQMKPGRFLTKYSDLDPNTIRDLATRLAATITPSELKIANTPDEVKHVYLNGPNSCMAKPFKSLPKHPSAIYAEPGDLRVAYIERFEKPSARTVIWPERKIFSRLYGDDIRLRSLLEAEGFNQGSLVGAKVPRIPFRGGVILPYVDSTHRAQDEGTHLVLGEGQINAHQQRGHTSNHKRCRLTREWLPAHEFRWVYQPNGRRQSWHYKHVETHTYRCPHFGRVSNTVPKVTISDGTVVSQLAANSHYFFKCEGNGQYYYRTFNTYRIIDGKYFSLEHLNNVQAAA